MVWLIGGWPVCRCYSVPQLIDRTAQGKISERFWGFGDGIPEVAAEPKHTFDRPGNYRGTLIVWDAAGRECRAEIPGQGGTVDRDRPLWRFGFQGQGK
jgi:hypothetical protein